MQNSNNEHKQKRGLGDSKYNERRAECEEALRELQQKLNIKSLGELTEEEFEENKDLIKSETRQKEQNMQYMKTKEQLKL